MRLSRFFACLWAAFAAMWLATAATAGPYDGFTSRPGDRITNTITVDYFHNGRPMPPLTASDSFVVQGFPLTGTIKAYERHRGVGPVVSLPIAEGAWSPSGDLDGPFTPMGMPSDTSALTGGETYTVPATLALRETALVRQGVPVFFAIEDAALDMDASAVERVAVRLSNSVTGDTEVVLFVETGPNTGVFTGWVDTSGRPGVSNDGWLRTAKDSVIRAVYQDPFDVGMTLAVEVQVTPPAPEGRVFDAATGALLDGIRVTLVDAVTGEPATVLSEDLQASLPSTVRSGEPVRDSLGRTFDPGAGGFRFPYVADGTYRLLVENTPNHGAPSARTDAEMGGGPWLLTQASRLGVFTVDANNPARFDVPMDPVVGRPDVVRGASIDNGAVGDVFEYTVEVTPSAPGTITFRDELPPGVRFIPGTFRIDGVAWKPELSDNGRTLIFRDVPVRGAGIPVILTYGARIAADAETRSWTRVLTGAGAGSSDDHTIEVVDAFGLEEIAILGEVLAGPCGGPLEDRDLEGIRVLLENGEYALTDSDGMFTFRGIARHPRVVQIDVNTLPPGAKPVLCRSNTRAAGSAISRFVDVGPGQIARVDFHMVFDEAEVARAAAARAQAEAPLERVSAFDRFSPEWFAANPPTGAAVLSPRAGATPPSEALEVVVVRGVSERFRLELNGAPVEPTATRDPVTSADGLWVLERWSGVRVPQGRSRLAVVFEDSLTGGELRRETRDLAFATRVGRLTLDAEGATLHADGRTRPILRLKVTDRDGVPIRPGSLAQFSIEAPYAFLSRPPRDSAPGFERRPVANVEAEIREDGIVELELAPVRAPGKAKVSIMTERGPLTTEIPVRMDARPWVLVGLAEGTIASSGIRQHIRPLTSDANPYAGRVAFFAEGVIKGKWLLTLRYDSAQPRDSFYGIDPDKDYVVYGDRSVQGNEAQSRFPLYVRLRSDEAEFLIGDFQLDLDSMLIQETRKATGFRAVYETDKIRAMVFLAETDQRQARDRLALNGTVGPYKLTQGDIVPNSESVRLVTVSRLDATLELSSEGLIAGRDYVFDHGTGRIWLRRPIGAFTETFDRRVLVVDYESESGDIPTRMAGVRVEGDVSARMRVGVTAVHARRVEGQNVDVTLLGFDADIALGEQSRLRVEAVEARKAFTDTVLRNRAFEARFEHRTPTTEIFARYRHQRGDVELTADRRTDVVDIAQLGFSHRLSGPTQAPAEGVFVEGTATMERNRTTGEDRATVEALRVQRQARGVWGGGLSWSREDDGKGQVTESLSAVARAGWSSLDGRMRQDMEFYGLLWSRGTEAQTRLSLGMEYDLTDTVAVFARLDGTESADRVERGSAFTLGLKASPWEGFEGIFAMSRAQAQGMGGWGLYSSATQEFRAGEGAAWTFGVDVQKDFGARDVPMGDELGNPYIDEDFVAARLGYRVERETWALGADTEFRHADSGDTGNVRLRADGELGNGWSVGGEAFAGFTDQAGVRSKEIELRFAAAQRRYGRQPITLLQAEIEHQEDTDPTTTVFLSVHHNRPVGDKGELGLRYALRHTSTEIAAGRFSSLTHFAGAEYRHDISERFDIGVSGAFMHQVETGTTQESLGLSLGMTPFENGWLSLGYNFVGFDGDQFAATGATQQGPFVQFRFKFDQDTVQRMFR